MKNRLHRALIGALALAVLCVPVLTAAAPAPKPKGNVAAGKLAFAKEGCTGCHVTKDYGTGKIGPDLSHAAKDGVAKLTAYIKKPKAGSIMPPFKGPAKTLNDMVAYLMTQK